MSREAVWGLSVTADSDTIVNDFFPEENHFLLCS
jgi:hypothetical protein